MAIVGLVGWFKQGLVAGILCFFGTGILCIGIGLTIICFAVTLLFFIISIEKKPDETEEEEELYFVTLDYQ